MPTLVAFFDVEGCRSKGISQFSIRFVDLEKLVREEGGPRNNGELPVWPRHEGDIDLALRPAEDLVRALQIASLLARSVAVVAHNINYDRGVIDEVSRCAPPGERQKVMTILQDVTWVDSLPWARQNLQRIPRNSAITGHELGEVYKYLTNRELKSTRKAKARADTEALVEIVRQVWYHGAGGKGREGIEMVLDLFTIGVRTHLRHVLKASLADDIEGEANIG